MGTGTDDVIEVTKSDLIVHLSVSTSGVQVDEDLQSSEVGPTLDGTAVTGGDTSGESGLGLIRHELNESRNFLETFWRVCSCGNSRLMDCEQIC